MTTQEHIRSIRKLTRKFCIDCDERDKCKERVRMRKVINSDRDICDNFRIDCKYLLSENLNILVKLWKNGLNAGTDLSKMISAELQQGLIGNRRKDYGVAQETETEDL